MGLSRVIFREGTSKAASKRISGRIGTGYVNNGKRERRCGLVSERGNISLVGSVIPLMRLLRCD